MAAADLSWRAQQTVLVSAAQAFGGIAAIRSLGRAGYRVVASAEDPAALGLQSRYAALGLTEPKEPEAFCRWLDQVIAEHGVRLIIPSEGFLLKLRGQFARYRHLLPVPEAEALAYAGLSKYDLFVTCRDAGLAEHLPPHLLLDAADEAPSSAELEALGFPLFLKVDAGYALGDASSQVLKCRDVPAFMQAFGELRRSYRKLLVQGYVDGVGVGAFLARWRGQELGAFMHKRLHEVPHTGGASSYRSSWFDEAVLADARRRMEALGWDGVGMFEYRWNPQTRKFYLLEFNSRFWGSLHLALFAGIDFPRLLADAFLGHPERAPQQWPLTYARATFPGELGYLMSLLRDPAVGAGRKLGALLEFVVLGLRPDVHSDLWFPGDRRLYFKAAYRAVRDLLR